MRRFPLFAALVIIGLAVSAARCAAPSQTVEPVGFAIEEAEADTLILGGGCFWCMEPPFEKLDGVASVVSGFAGGDTPNPTYDEVAAKRTTHIEVVEVIYDPTRVDIETLLLTYWHNVDPVDGGGQFCDRGSPYRPAIFAATPEIRELAETQKAELNERLDRPVAVEILDNAPFYAAEDYHQDFYRTNPRHYTRYRAGCQRDARLIQLWGDKAGKASDAL
ncbi:MAG: peptide-methionine (S)-S-oxide reductase MsrA [Rubricoccaceae bacterium]